MLATQIGPYEHARSIDLWQAREMLRAGTDQPPHIDVIRRWCRGRSVHGRNVALPSVRCGRQLRTMPGWVEWFLAECIRAETPTPRVRERTGRQARAAHLRADARLRAAGM